MTPILVGRWQTLTFLILCVGVPVTLIFGAIIQDMMTPLAVLGYAYVQGMVLAVVYNMIQKRRWERDWSPLIFTMTGIIEAILLFIYIRSDYLPMVANDLPVQLFVIHYSAVWLSMFVFAWGGMKIIFPWWRFRGGRVFI